MVNSAATPQDFHQVLKADGSFSYHEMFSRQASELVIDLLNTVNDVQKHGSIRTRANVV